MSPESCLKDVVPIGGAARAWVSFVATLLVNADGFNVPERSICRGVNGEPW